MSANPQMAWDTAQPWLPMTRAGLLSAVNRLQTRGDKDGLFVLLVKAAASGDWDVFDSAFEQASEIRGVIGLLHAHAGDALSRAYEVAGLPPKLFPLFRTVTSLSIAAHKQIRGLRPSKRLRTIILDKAFRKSAVASLPIDTQIVQALYA